MIRPRSEGGLSELRVAGKQASKRPPRTWAADRRRHGMSWDVRMGDRRTADGPPVCVWCANYIDYAIVCTSLAITASLMVRPWLAAVVRAVGAPLPRTGTRSRHRVQPSRAAAFSPSRRSRNHQPRTLAMTPCDSDPANCGGATVSPPGGRSIAAKARRRRRRLRNGGARTHARLLAARRTRTRWAQASTRLFLPPLAAPANIWPFERKKYCIFCQ